METCIRALVIEDDDVVAELLGLQLEFGVGATVTRARDGYVGMAQLRSGDFDVAVLDLALPGAPGRTILDRALGHGVRTPLVVLTACADQSAEARRLGAFAVFAKPYVRSELLAAVRAATGSPVAA